MEHTEHYNLNLPDYTDQADVEKINENTRAIDTAMYGMKTKQTAVASPTSTGTAVEFINTVAQDTNGKLTNLTKKTIPTFVKSGSSAATGLVPKPSTTAGTTKYLREDATWQVPPNTTYSAASGGGLTLSSNAFSITNSGVTAGSYGPTGNVTGNDGTTINVPQVTVNAKGQVTGVVNRVYTSKNTTYESKAAASGGTAVSLCTTGEKYTWNSKVSCTAANVKSAIGAGSGTTFYRKDGTWVNPTAGLAIIRTYTLLEEVSVSGGDTKSIKANDLVYFNGVTGASMSVPSGYAAAGVLTFNSGDSSVGVELVNGAASGSTTAMRVRNYASSSKSIDVTITVLYLKSGIVA